MSDEENFKSIIGSQLKEARQQRRLSQTELAEMVGKDPSTISNYESGLRLIHISDLPRFAEVLDVPISYFFGKEQVYREASYAFKHWLNDHQGDVLDRMRASDIDLSPNLRSIVMAILESLWINSDFLEKREITATNTRQEEAKPDDLRGYIEQVVDSRVKQILEELDLLPEDSDLS